MPIYVCKLTTRIKTLLGAGTLLAVSSFAPALSQTNEILDPDKAISAGQKIIENQITAFISEEYRYAFSFAAPIVHERFPSVERFIWMVRHGYYPLFRPSQFRFLRAITHEGKIYQEIEVRDLKGNRYEATYSLIQLPNGEWRIAGVSMQKAEGKGI